MKYTENYHLPQWAMEDRIMMDDFNQMCADMEAGLTKNAQGAAAESAQIRADVNAREEQIKADAGEAENRTFDRLCRVTYNHYCSARTIEPFPKQMGAVYQDFYETGGVAGMVRMDDYLWTAGNEKALDKNTIAPYLSQPSVINASSNLCAVVFTPPYGGWLTRVWLIGGRPSAAGGSVNASVTLYDQTAGTTEVSGTTTINLMSLTSSAAYHFNIGCFLHVGHQYRLEVKLIPADSSVVLKMDLNANFHFEITSAGGGNPALTYRFQENMTSSGGVFLVHYTVWGSGNGLFLDWEGETFTPYKTRTITDNRGRTLQEAEFRIKKEIPMDSIVTLRLDCGGGKREYCLYDWGGVLIG